MESPIDPTTRHRGPFKVESSFMTLGTILRQAFDSWRATFSVAKRGLHPLLHPLHPLLGARAQLGRLPSLGFSASIVVRCDRVCKKPSRNSIFGQIRPYRHYAGGCTCVRQPFGSLSQGYAEFVASCKLFFALLPAQFSTHLYET